MPSLKNEIILQEQRGLDTFLEVRLSQSEEEGGASTKVGITLHGVDNDQVKIEQGGIFFRSPGPDNAPCILMIAAPLSAPFM